MGQLQTHDQIVIAAECVAVGLPANLEHAPEIRSRFFVEMQLPGTGSAFEGNRRGFSPDKFGASAAKAKISAKGQLIGSTVERAITALHGLNAERIAKAKSADDHRSKERTQVVGEAQIQPQ